jgi:hypothetical protein
MTTLLALGAEKQAATSLASAHPDCAVIFVSDSEILDGSDLANVRMVYATPSDLAKLSASADRVVPLCPRWLPHDHALSRVFDRLERALPGRCLPVSMQLPSLGQWVVKGNRWHRPDAPLSGDSRQLADVIDVHGCGLVFQPYREAKATIMTIGRRERVGAVFLGVVEVFEERFFRDDILQAGETIDATEVVEASLEVLDALDHRGFFTLNWLRTDEGLKLSSWRPVPRAVFQSFLHGGVDLLAAVSAVEVVVPGVRFIADPNYVSFERLPA